MDSATPAANLPRPPRDWRAHAVAAGILLAAATFWIVALSGGSGGSGTSRSAARALVIAAASAPAAPVTAPAPGAGVIAQPTAAQGQQLDVQAFKRHDAAHVRADWMAGFYPLYDTSSRTFGVNWLLLASIHKQETAFSTAPDTYRGLNFAHCCGGPMQFNVSNGPITTWARVSDSYRYGVRPAGYPHYTLSHPSIYDDFDAMMAAARLLAADGAGARLDYAAWSAAYDYYGHDATGVIYADQVLARAIAWSQKGFCINCSLDQSMVDAVHAAYGAPMLASLTSPPPTPTPQGRTRRGAASAQTARAR